MYKKFVFVLMMALLSVSLFAQQSQPAAKGMAPFKITLANGKTFTYKDLKKNIPTVLVYFSPTCDHCKEFTKELMKHEDELKNKQIVMVGYEPLAEIKKFDSAFHLTNKINFKVGTEGYSFIVQKYYGVQRFPYVVMFNKQMKPVKTVPFVTDPEGVSKEIANLQ